MTAPNGDPSHCPPCELCGLAAAVAYDFNERQLPAPRLRCCACGHQWDATAEDRTKAERADAAYFAGRD